MESSTETVAVDDFKIIKHTDSLSKDCFHFSVTHPQIKFTGFGTAFDEQLALKVAINECLERHCFSTSKEALNTKTTSGYAAHNNSEQARESALCELLERDAILTGWLLKKPVSWIKTEDYSPFVNEQVQLFLKFGFDIRIGLTSISNERFCLIGVLLGGNYHQNFGAAFSSSCHKSIESASISIIKELRRAATVVCNLKSSNYSTQTEHILPSNVTNANDHFLYYANKSNMKNIQWYLTTNSSFPENNEFNITVKSLKPPLTPSWDFHMAHADSEDLQKFYFGMAKFRRINKRRLKKEWTLGHKLNKELHVLP